MTPRARSTDVDEAVLAAVPDGIVVVAQDGTVQWAGGSITEITGWAPEELVGIECFAFVHVDDRDRALAAVASTFSSPGPAMLRCRVLRRDGTYATLEFHARVTVGTEGAMAVATFRELDAQAALEASLRAALAEAKAADAERSEFLARLSHELRTPLNGVLGFADLLSSEPLSGPAADDVNHIRSAGRHLLGLIDELLAFDDAKAATPYPPPPVSIAAIVRQSIQLVQPQARVAGVTLAGPGPQEDGPSARIHEGRLIQVLLNLLTNGVKFTAPGGSVSVPVSEVGGRVAVVVSDTGRGIPASSLGRLGEPFERLDPSVPGIGLGLSVVRTIVESAGGSLHVSSRVGEGSEFTVELPLAARSAAAATGPATGEGDGDGVSYRVLVVEDDDVNLELCTRVLARIPGVEVIVAQTVQSATRAVTSGRPDLVLLDLGLPDGDGREVLAHVRAEPGLEVTRVVVVTADARIEERDLLLSDGADGYLTKPVDVTQLVDIVGKARPPRVAPDESQDAR
ncbi:MAG: ATP-binding protein [Acidimicrobiales bacterium]